MSSGRDGGCAAALAATATIASTDAECGNGPPTELSSPRPDRAAPRGTCYAVSAQPEVRIMRTTLLRSVAVTALCGLASAPVGAQQVNKEQVPGIRNLSRIESTVACAGAITPCGRGGHQGDGLRGHHQPAPGHRAGRGHRGPHRGREGRRHPLHPHPVQRHESGSGRRRRVPEGDDLARGSSPPSSIERAVAEPQVCGS